MGYVINKHCFDSVVGRVVQHIARPKEPGERILKTAFTFIERGYFTAEQLLQGVKKIEPEAVLPFEKPGQPYFNPERRRRYEYFVRALLGHGGG